jgi:hypothetical protein
MDFSPLEVFRTHLMLALNWRNDDLTDAMAGAGWVEEQGGVVLTARW